MPQDVIVVGLGAFGAAILYQLASRKVAVTGIDRFSPPHVMGSSHGETRITRLAVGEGDSYAPLVRRSHEIWRALEASEGARLMTQTGGLIFGPREGMPRHHGRDAFVNGTIALAERTGIAHEVLEPAAIAARYPQFALRGDEIAYFEPEAGMLAPEACVRVQLAAARAHGATIWTNEQVLSIDQDAGGVTVRTASDTLRAARCIVSAGAWVGQLLGGAVARRTRVYRQTLHWFAADDAAAYAPGRFPIFIWIYGPTEADSFYGFPETQAGAGVKVASEQYATVADPDTVVRDVASEESAAMHRRHVAGRLRGVSARAVDAKACLYTVTPDAGFIVDRAPGMDRVLVVSACSGHGFKHSAALGEAIAEQVADGGSRIPLDAFALSRFGVA
jgi:sarcosine oxidase